MLLRLLIIVSFIQVAMWWFAADVLYDHMELLFPRCGVGSVVVNSNGREECACPAVWATNGCQDHLCQHGGTPRFIRNDDQDIEWGCDCGDGPWMGELCSDTRRANATHCQSHWYGENCEQTCHADKAINDTHWDDLCGLEWNDVSRLHPLCVTCSGHGTCLENVNAPCICDAGYLSDPETPKTMCTLDCLGLGTCADTHGNARDNKTNSCAYYYDHEHECGDHDILNVFKAEDMCCACGGGGGICNGRGTCDAVGSAPFCNCDEGFVGDGCEHPCPVSATGDICDLAGDCIFNDVQNRAACRCMEGRKGPTCELTTVADILPFA